MTVEGRRLAVYCGECEDGPYRSREALREHERAHEYGRRPRQPERDAEIVRRVEAGETYSALTACYGLTKARIGQIVRRELGTQPRAKEAAEALVRAVDGLLAAVERGGAVEAALADVRLARGGLSRRCPDG